MQSPVFLALLVVVIGLSACEPSEIILGPASVTDGDSIKIAETRIRLHAIDAPEARQPCRRNGAPWRCGAAAAAKLRELVGTSDIVCTTTDMDSYGRTVAICNNGVVDLGAEMVFSGLALAYREFGDDYVDLEDEARAAGRGVWATDFAPPWEWRRNPQSASPTQDEPSISNERGDCRIKGNISWEKDERIYHVPGSRSYEETVIDLSRGERYFCSEEDARTAGWRAPRGN
jgi:endonuclease YncB( thermonuclease family)